MYTNHLHDIVYVLVSVHPLVCHQNSIKSWWCGSWMADFLIHFLSPESFWCFVRGYLGACSMHCHCCHRREDSSAENIGQDRWDGIRVHVAFCSTARDHENIVLQSIYLPNHSYPRFRLFSFPFLMQHSLVPRPSYFWCCLYRISLNRRQPWRVTALKW